MNRYETNSNPASAALHPGSVWSSGAIKYALWITPLAYVLLLCWLDPALPWPLTLSTPRIWGLAALNLLPVLILNAAFLVITRRLLLSNWLTVLALGAVYFVNHLKMQELATPLLPDDFRFLKTLGVSYSFFAQYLASSRMQLCFAILTLSVTLLLVRREPTIEFLKGRSRGAIALAAVVLAISLAHGSAPWKVIYNAGNLEFEPWAPRDSAARTGIITNMLLFYWELADDSPDSVNLEQARRVLHDRSLLAPLPVAAVERTELPDIIIFQSESLFDPSRLAGVDYDALPRLRAAMSRGWSGNLHVPTFGGGTIRTEFEVLTGLPLAAFARVRYPYLQLRRSEIPGLVRELKARDYRTLALHPNGGAFWNRNDAFRAMGFDRFINGPAFDGAERHGHYVSDAALVERVMAEMDDDGAPQMIMAISIQNHGPYDDVPLASNERPEIQIAGLDATTQSALQTYMAMVQATDQQLARLIDFVESRQRRTLLLVYSDHMPPLNRVFAQVPFQNGRRPEEQAVPWLLLDNGSDEVRTDDHPSWFLPAVVLERAGIRDVAYFNLLQEIRRQEVWNCSCDAPSETTTALAHLRYFDQIESAMASDELL